MAPVSTRWLPVLALLFLSLAPAGVRAQNAVKGRVTAVEAGDLIRVRLEAWEVRVRLHGIECPATPPLLAAKARDYAARRVADTRVTLDVRGTGPKQTLYGEVRTADGQSLNEEMVRAGLATWARRYAPRRTELGDLERDASDGRRGMWGDPNGANVVLPPSLAEKLRATPTPTPPPRPSPTPARPAPRLNTAERRADPPARVQAPPPPMTPTPGANAPPAANVTPTAATTPATATPPATATAAPRRAGPPVREVALPALAFLSAFFLVLFQRASAWETRCLVPQLITSLLLALAVTMLLPLPLLLLGGRFTLTNATLAVGAAAPLAGASLWAAGALSRREQVLRAAPRRRVADARTAHGFARVSGETSAPVELVQSQVGRIPGIYIHEITWRYESDPEHGRGQGARRVVPHQWAVLQDETHAADFLLTDATGSITVDGDRAKFLPLRVARFYNDIPVEAFFDRPYTGDTRTEVYFIPATANVTVWGRAYRTAHPVPGASEPRVGYDPVTENLLVVEGNPARVYRGRTMLGLLLTFLAIALACVAAHAVLAPGAWGR